MVIKIPANSITVVPGNPTRCILGEALAQLEKGATGIVTCTGMAAITFSDHFARP